MGRRIKVERVRGNGKQINEEKNNKKLENKKNEEGKD
jgi:hypothetical protein